jgi:hypothetical protein
MCSGPPVQAEPATASRVAPHARRPVLVVIDLMGDISLLMAPRLDESL